MLPLVLDLCVSMLLVVLGLCALMLLVVLGLCPCGVRSGLSRDVTRRGTPPPGLSRTPASGRILFPALQADSKSEP